MALLNTQQAAEKLGVSAIRIRQLIRAGKIVAVNLGRDYAIEESALDGVVVYGKSGRPSRTVAMKRVKAMAAYDPSKKAAKKAGTKKARKQSKKEGN